MGAGRAASSWRPPDPWFCRPEALSGSEAPGRGEAPVGALTRPHPLLPRDIAKNALLPLARHLLDAC